MIFRIVKTLYPQDDTKLKIPRKWKNAICHSCFFLLLLLGLVAACQGRAAPTIEFRGSETPTVLTVAVTPVLAVQSPVPSLQFDGKHAYDEYLLAQMNFGIRPTGSVAIRATGDYILDQLKKSKWQAEVQEFTFRNVPIRNIIATAGVGKGPLIILGAHYDTRPRANMDKVDPAKPVPGANDGASGAAVLLELARTLDVSRLKNEVWLAFFDAEDNGDLSACDLRVAPQLKPTSLCDTNPWTWSVGAEHVAANLPQKPAAVIILDMIGDANQDIYYEQNSDMELQKELWDIAAQLGYAAHLIPQPRWSMTDDHTPFLKRGIRAVDMIDFDYPPWHTTEDTADKVSAASLERVGRVLETWLEEKGLAE